MSYFPYYFIQCHLPINIRTHFIDATKNYLYCLVKISIENHDFVIKIYTLFYNFRPHKLLERQYQLKAQKRHEEYLKHHSYLQTARYFERATAMAKQFSSWSTHGELHSDRLEKIRRVEKLIERREKLEHLLTKEDKHYKRELEEKMNAKRPAQEPYTLEELRQRLLDKRAEESLYYPHACRPLRSYALSHTDTTKKLESLFINDKLDYSSSIDTHR